MINGDGGNIQTGRCNKKYIYTYFYWRVMQELIEPQLGVTGCTLWMWKKETEQLQKYWDY